MAAGQIEKVSLQFENETQRMPLEIQGPFREAAAALMESWSSGGDLKMPPEGIARGALIRTIQNRVQGWREQMEKLASELSGRSFSRRMIWKCRMNRQAKNS